MFEQEIEKGITLLNEKHPGWYNKVNLDTLDMYSNCILKQIYGNYGDGLDSLGLKYGFDLGFSALDDYSTLNRMWTEAILKLREEKVMSNRVEVLVNPSKNTVSFEDIGIGQAFEFDSEIYIRVEPFNINEEHNALRVPEFDTHCMAEDIIVIPREAKLEIK